MKRTLKDALSALGAEGGEIQEIIKAAMDGNAQLVAEMLENGADINTVEPTRGFTCLHIACLNGDDSVVDVLLDFNEKRGGLDFSMRTFDPPRYAWQLAMSAHHYELADRVDQLGSSGGPSVSMEPRI
jgi:ankyrin repeat protein